MNKKNINQNIYFLSLAFIVTTLPFSITASSFSILLLSINWLIFFKLSNVKNVIRQPYFYISISLFIIYVFGLFYSENLDVGLFKIEKRLSFLAFPIIIFTSGKLSENRLKKLLTLFVISMITAALLCLLFASYRSLDGNIISYNAHSYNYENHFFYHALGSILGFHAVYFSVYIAFSLYLVIFLFKPKHKAGIIFKYLIFGFLTLFLTLLASKTILISFLFLTSIFLGIYFHQKKGLKTTLFIVLSLIIFLLSLITFLPETRQRLLEIRNSSFSFKNDLEKNKNLAGKLDGVEMRLALGYFTLKAGENSIITGVGTGDDQDKLQEIYLENNFFEGYYPKYNPHNQYLHIWLELGFLGLSVLLTNFFYPLYLSFIKKEKAYSFFLLLLILSCLTESFLASNKGIVFYSLFNSLFYMHFFFINKQNLSGNE